MRRGGYGSDVTYYWVSAGLVVVSLVVLVLVAARLRRALRQFSTLRSATQAVLDSELGLLRARRAALAVAARRRSEEPEGH
jgi:biopolymer transport protein ExbB/TolQ